MNLTKMEKEAVAIGASIGAGCQPCIEFHFKAAIEAGFTEKDLAKMLELGKKVADELLQRYIVKGEQLLNNSSSLKPISSYEDKLDNLLVLGVVIGANAKDICKSSIEKLKELQCSESEIKVAVRVAQVVQNKAAEFTKEEIVQLIGGEKDQTGESSCCGPLSSSGSSCC